MRFIEYETWTIKEGRKVDHDKMIKVWFEFIQKHWKEMFSEFVSAKYYRQVDRDGNPTKTYIMVFEYSSREAHHTYKDRRKNWDGPYAEYKKVDPYQFFNLESVTTEYWQPLETEYWFDYSDRI